MSVALNLVIPDSHQKKPPMKKVSGNKVSRKTVPGKKKSPKKRSLLKK